MLLILIGMFAGGPARAARFDHLTARLHDALVKCETRLAGEPVEFALTLPGGEVRLSPLRPSTLGATRRFTETVFPVDQRGARWGTKVSLLPPEILSRLTHRTLGTRLVLWEYWRLLDDHDRQIGVASLHAANDSMTAWLGWYWVAPEARGAGRGRALLEFAIARARRLGYATLRLWISTAPRFATAERILHRRGFVRQDAHAADPDSPAHDVVIYSLNLHRLKPDSVSLHPLEIEPFTGSLREAMLGRSPAEIEKAIRLWSERDR